MLTRTHNKIREATVSWLKEISRRESNYLYRKGKLDQENYLRRIQYPQTWWMQKYIPLRILWRRWYNYKGNVHRNPLYIYVAVEFLCGLLTGHEVSATEHGYGGGNFIDRHCRWCDKVFLEPIEESEWAQEGELKDIIAEMRDGQEPTFEE